jgi:hypothetical protein
MHEHCARVANLSNIGALIESFRLPDNSSCVLATQETPGWHILAPDPPDLPSCFLPEARIAQLFFSRGPICPLFFYPRPDLPCCFLPEARFALLFFARGPICPRVVDPTSVCLQKLSQVTGLERGQVSRKITHRQRFRRHMCHRKNIGARPVSISVQCGPNATSPSASGAVRSLLTGHLWTPVVPDESWRVSK